MFSCPLAAIMVNCRAMTLTLCFALAVSALSSPSENGVTLASSLDVRSARLVAQAPPPVPERSVGGPMDRIAQLDAEISSINDQLRGLSTSWPFGALAMAYIGWIVSPITLVGLIILGVGAAVGVPGVITLGVVLLVVGLGAVALGIAGIVVGSTAASKAKDEKQLLERRRRELQDELRALKAQADLGRFDGNLLTVATF
jgi:hypothetical protein